MKIKVLYIIDKLTAAGTQTNLLEIVRNLNKSRVEPHVIALVSGGALVEEFRIAGVEPRILAVRRAYGPSGLKALFEIRNYMKEHKIDIVQTFFFQADLLGGLAAKMAGVHYRITSRRDEGFWKNARQRAATKHLNKLYSHILCNSNAVRRAVLRDEHSDPDKVEVLYNGICPSKFIPSEIMRSEARSQMGFTEQDHVIGAVGNMKHPVKGQATLIEAMPEILRSCPTAKLLLVGDGELKVELKELCVSLGVQKSVIFAGSRRDIPGVLNALDVYCMPSHSEGFSNAVLEAMACSGAVVATNVGGNPEVVLDAKTGYLVPPQDAQALAYRITGLLKDEKKRHAFGDSARKTVLEKFTVEGMAQSYETFYRRVVDGTTGTSTDSSSEVKTVMQVIWSLDLGGAEQVVMNLAKGLDAQKYRVIVCCLNEKGRYAPEVEELGIKVTALHKRPKVDLSIIGKLIRVIRAEKVDLVHTHLFTSNFWGRVASWLAKVPVVATEHNLDVWKKKHHFHLDNWLAAKTKKMIFVSKGVENFYRSNLGSLNGNARVLYNGIETNRYKKRGNASQLAESLGFKKDDLVLGIVGRLVPQKRHDLFLKSIAALKSKGFPVKGLILGDGPERTGIETQIRELNLSEDVKLVGFITELPPYYQLMNVFVLTSDREGFPMTMLEAMAAGVPVVATDVGGVGECITNGKNGFTVQPNDLDAAVRAIAGLLYNKKMAAEMGSRGQQDVQERFSIETMVKRHENLYREVLAS